MISNQNVIGYSRVHRLCVRESSASSAPSFGVVGGSSHSFKVSEENDRHNQRYTSSKSNAFEKRKRRSSGSIDSKIQNQIQRSSEDMSQGKSPIGLLMVKSGSILPKLDSEVSQSGNKYHISKFTKQHDRKAGSKRKDTGIGIGSPLTSSTFNFYV